MTQIFRPNAGGIFPRLTDAEIASLPNPQLGDTVINITIGKKVRFDGLSWVEDGSGGPGGSSQWHDHVKILWYEYFGMSDLPSASSGERYLIYGDFTGTDWEGHNTDIAIYDGSAWSFESMEIGDSVYSIKDNDVFTKKDTNELSGTLERVSDNYEAVLKTASDNILYVGDTRLPGVEFPSVYEAIEYAKTIAFITTEAVGNPSGAMSIARGSIVEFGSSSGVLYKIDARDIDGVTYTFIYVEKLTDIADATSLTPSDTISITDAANPTNRYEFVVSDKLVQEYDTTLREIYINGQRAPYAGSHKTWQPSAETPVTIRINTERESSPFTLPEHFTVIGNKTVLEGYVSAEDNTSGNPPVIKNCVITAVQGEHTVGTSSSLYSIKFVDCVIDTVPRINTLVKSRLMARLMNTNAFQNGKLIKINDTNDATVLGPIVSTGTITTAPLSGDSNTVEEHGVITTLNVDTSIEPGDRLLPYTTEAHCIPVAYMPPLYPATPADGDYVLDLFAHTIMKYNAGTSTWEVAYDILHTATDITILAATNSCDPQLVKTEIHITSPGTGSDPIYNYTKRTGYVYKVLGDYLNGGDWEGIPAGSYVANYASSIMSSFQYTNDVVLSSDFDGDNTDLQIIMGTPATATTSGASHYTVDYFCNDAPSSPTDGQLALVRPSDDGSTPPFDVADVVLEYDSASTTWSPSSTQPADGDIIFLAGSTTPVAIFDRGLAIPTYAYEHTPFASPIRTVSLSPITYGIACHPFGVESDNNLIQVTINRCIVKSFFSATEASSETAHLVEITNSIVQGGLFAGNDYFTNSTIPQTLITPPVLTYTKFFNSVIQSTKVLGDSSHTFTRKGNTYINSKINLLYLPTNDIIQGCYVDNAIIYYLNDNISIDRQSILSSKCEIYHFPPPFADINIRALNFKALFEGGELVTDKDVALSVINPETLLEQPYKPLFLPNIVGEERKGGIQLIHSPFSVSISPGTTMVPLYRRDPDSGTTTDDYLYISSSSVVLIEGVVVLHDATSMSPTDAIYRITFGVRTDDIGTLQFVDGGSTLVDALTVDSSAYLQAASPFVALTAPDTNRLAISLNITNTNSTSRDLLVRARLKLTEVSTTS